MPQPPSEGQVRTAWLAFVRALRSVTAGLSEHRHEDQFLRVREAALTLAETSEVAAEIERGYWATRVNPKKVPPTPAATQAAVADVVLMELESFPLAVQVREGQVKDGSAKPEAGRSLREAAKTILGSVGDVFKLS